MDLLNDLLFQALFNTDVPRIVLKTNIPDFTIVTYNEAFKITTNIQERAVKGQSLWEVYNPEYSGDDGKSLLSEALVRAIDTARPVNLPPFKYNILSKDQNTIETNWWEMEIIPVGGGTQKPELLMVTTQNITEKMISRGKIDDGLLREQNLNEELAATNEELSAANEELTSTIEDLKQSQSALHELNDKLEKRVVTRTNQLFTANYRTEKQRDRLKKIIDNIPSGFCILTGKDMIIEMANDAILKLWHRDEGVIGKAIIVVFPELKEQEFPEILDSVYRTGIPHGSSDARVDYIIDGKMQTRYRDYSYTPLLDDEDKVESILVLVDDVTDRILSRQREQQLAQEVSASNEELSSINEELRAANEELYQSKAELEDLNKKVKASEKTLQQAIEAAHMGTWSADLTTDELTISDRARMIHGVPAGMNLTLTQAMEMIAPEYREKITGSIKEAIATGDNFEDEYVIMPMDGSKPRWLRSTGKIEYDADGKPANINGTILDISELKADEQRKNDFIGMVSHELKTPLTSLKAYVQMLNMKAKNANDTFTAASLDKIEIQINKMGTMINGFLNLSRLESGKIYLTKQKFDLDHLVREVIDETILATSSHIINLEPCDTPVPVNADRDKIGHVISNLLSNAIKYSPRGNSIDVKCEIIENMAQVSVKDDGMGIKPQDIDRLFERYYRVETKHTENISGFGIGLYLSAELVHRHHGKIWAESESGVGSTFKFTLPLDV